MSLQKTEAIVLKSLKQGETSKILTFYTRSRGKVKAIAKGARSSRSRFGGSLEPLNYITMVFYEKENRDLQSLSQADIVESFQRVRHDLEKTALAMACCELVDRAEVGIAPNPQLFKLLLQTLRDIDRTTNNPIDFFRACQVRLFDIMGIRPNFEECMNCARPSSGTVKFDIGSGGYLCPSCSRPASPGFILPRQVLSALLSIQSKPAHQLNGPLPSATCEQQIDDFLAHYLRYHIDGVYNLSSLKFLKSVKKKLGAELSPIHEESDS
ncbi:DNA repair protein RecO [bacterium]|nr:DNA repair protein RecO [bacterium]